jgi:sensor histidine kinase regulating citrate/malate metabolism
LGIKAKILAPAIVITLVVAIAIMVTNLLLFSGFVDTSTVDRVNAAALVVNHNLESLKAEARAVSLSMARHPDIIGALQAQDRAGLLAHARALQDVNGVEFCTVTGPDGAVIVRTHELESHGDSVLAQVNIQSAVYGEPITVIEEGSEVRLSVRSGAPVLDSGGAVVGVVSVGFRLDTDTFVDKIKGLMGCETTIVLGSERIATTVVDENGARITGTYADAGIVETVLGGSNYSGRVDIDGNIAVCKYSPIEGPDGRPIGMFFVGQYLEEELRTISAFVQGGSVILILMLAVSTVTILLIVGRIVKPIRAMTAAATALAAGDSELLIELDTKDETRTLADAFNRMLENTRLQVQLVESIAAGDMSITLEPRSEKDQMNRALEKLNATIKAQAAEIRGEHERVKLLMDATPLASRLWNRDYKLIECNEAAVKLFGLESKREYIERYDELSP